MFLTVSHVLFRKGSVIADFDIEYPSLHREQLVQIIDSMDQRKMLGELPIGEYRVNSTKGNPLTLNFSQAVISSFSHE